jgi:hypothetical protein
MYENQKLGKSDFTLGHLSIRYGQTSTSSYEVRTKNASIISFFLRLSAKHHCLIFIIFITKNFHISIPVLHNGKYNNYDHSSDANARQAASERLLPNCRYGSRMESRSLRSEVDFQPSDLTR